MIVNINQTNNFHFFYTKLSKKLIFTGRVLSWMIRKYFFTEKKTKLQPVVLTLTNDRATTKSLKKKSEHRGKCCQLPNGTIIQAFQICDILQKVSDDK